MGSHTAATATLNALRNLTPSSLHLRRWLFSDLLIGPFSSVECLKLDYVDFGYSQGVVDIFATFPNVRELSMTSCSRLVQSRECVYVSCPPPLRSLEFAYCKMDPLLHDFIRGRIVPTNVFSIHRLRYDDIPVVGEYFSMFGNVLQEIRIGFSYDRHDVLGMSNLTLCFALACLILPSEGFCASARLHCLTGFQRLSLDTRFYGPGFSDLHIKLLASILNIIPSSTLKKLVLEIPTPPIEPRFAGWRQIGEVLQQPRFSQLTELVFIPTTEPYEHFERWIREDLRALEERGILSCPRWLT